ncbi:MAG TPA: DUF4258 domain-containing protein [Anaerolineales bacterium]|nr:DUF4258 domain-containing protein [Anaerolineales bacterium]
MSNYSLLYRLHAVQRMFERKIALSSVSQAVRSGETIEDYSAEMAQPGRLILGFQGKRPLHVVVSEDPKAGEVIVITVYIPDLDRWDKLFKSRRP